MERLFEHLPSEIQEDIAEFRKYFRCEKFIKNILAGDPHFMDYKMNYLHYTLKIPEAPFPDYGKIVYIKQPRRDRSDHLYLGGMVMRYYAALKRMRHLQYDHALFLTPSIPYDRFGITIKAIKLTNVQNNRIDIFHYVSSNHIFLNKKEVDNYFANNPSKSN